MSPDNQEVPKSAEDAVEKELEEENEALPFPNARVVAVMREVLDKDKIIRARVKKDMNEWLGEMCKGVTKELNKSPYSVIEAGDLHKILKKYEQFEELARQKDRIRTSLERIIQDAQMLMNDLERSFKE